jgi:cytochrome c oxidase subunit 4
MTSQSQVRSAHAISNPTLAGIEKRWEAMPPQEQAELWMQLRDRMKVDWNEMTLQEKKAGMDRSRVCGKPFSWGILSRGSQCRRAR